MASCGESTTLEERSQRPTGGSATLVAPSPPAAAPQPLQVLELFSGVGGFHLALRSAFHAGGTSESRLLDVLAVDNSAPANMVYNLNFPNRPLRTNIEHLHPATLAARDLWLLSPPCQPHTRTSNARCRDTSDARSAPLSHVTAALRASAPPPRALLLENVAGFLGSTAWYQFVAALESLGFSWQAFLLTPLMFGVPNSRPRLFLLARRVPVSAWGDPALCGVLSVLPPAVVRGRADIQRESTVAITSVVPLVLKGIDTAVPCAHDADVVMGWSEKKKPSDEMQLCEKCAIPSTAAGSRSRAWGAAARALRDYESHRLREGVAPSEQTEPASDCDVALVTMQRCASHWPQAQRIAKYVESALSLRTTGKAAAPSARFHWEDRQASSQAEWSERKATDLALPDGCREWRSSLGRSLTAASLARCHRCVDIVTTDSVHSNCFTKGYGQTLMGSGSILANDDFVKRFCSVDNRGRWLITDSGKQQLQQLAEKTGPNAAVEGLRLFSAAEVATLLGYPSDFAFPDALTERQRCALLGNGLSLPCATAALAHLLRECGLLSQG